MGCVSLLEGYLIPDVFLGFGDSVARKNAGE